MQPDLIPNGFWSNEGGPWYWSFVHGAHDAATHGEHGEVLDELFGVPVCHVIE